MLTYADLKKAESLALHASRHNFGAPHAIVSKPKREAWHDFSGREWKVVLHTHDVPEETVIVGGICADMKAKVTA